MRSPVISGNLRSFKTFDSPLPCGQVVLVVKRIWTMSHAFVDIFLAIKNCWDLTVGRIDIVRIIGVVWRS
jgi:hypothetical protein